MRNSRLLLVLFVLLLALGLGGGAFLLFGDGSGDARSRSNVVASGNPCAGGSGAVDPLAAANTGTQGNATGPVNSATHTGPAANETHQPANTVAKPATVPPTPGPETTPPVEANGDWEKQISKVTIRGTVLFKADNRPAPGATVTAEAQGSEDLQPGGGGGRIRSRGRPSSHKYGGDKPATEISGSTTTNGAGEYVLELSITSYVAKATREGARTPPIKRRRSGDDRGSSDDATPDPESEAPGSDRSDKDAPEFDGGLGFDGESLVVVARLAGYAPGRSGAIWPAPGSEHVANLMLAVPAAVSGRTVDSLTRAGIAGAQVSFNSMDDGRDGWTAPRTVTTDQDGYFALNDLPAGTYWWSISAQGYSDYNAMNGEGRLDVSNGGERNLGELPLMPEGRLTGVVVDARTGKPVRDATITLEAVNGGWGRWTRGVSRTGEDGRFTAEGLQAGVNTLKVQAAGYARFELPDVKTEPGKTVDVGTLRLDVGQTLLGMVLNANGEGVAGASVTLAEPPEGAFNFVDSGNTVASVTTQSNGSFELPAMSEGKWRLIVRAEGYADTRHDFEFSGDTRPLEVRVVRGGAIRGRVLDAAGAPVPNMQVTATAHSSSAYAIIKIQPDAQFGGFGGSTATTDAEGRFVIPKLRADDYLLAGGNEGTGTVRKDDISVEDERETDIGDLRLAGKGALRVFVTENGEPVQGLKVTLARSMNTWMSENKLQGVTDGTGATLIENVPAADYFIRTDRDKDTWDTEVMKKRRAVVRTGETGEFRLELRPRDGVLLHGRLTLGGKALFKDVYLIGTGNRATVMKNAKVAEGGFYEFAGLETGVYELYARESDTTVAAKLLVNAEQQGDLDITRDFAAMTLAGEVSTPQNSAAERAAVDITVRAADANDQMGGWLSGRAKCDAQGRYRIENVPAGAYRVTAVLAGVGSTTVEADVSAASRLDANMVLAANSGSLTVTIKKLNGQSSSGVGFGMVQLRDAKGAVVALSDQQQGMLMLSEGTSTTLETLAPGTYTVTVQGSGFLQVELPGVTIEVGKKAAVDVTLTAGAELHVTFINPELTQALLDTAQVKYFTAAGVEVPRQSNMFDAWGQQAPPAVPTVTAKYLSTDVSEVRIKVPGYAELVVPVQPQPGKKTERQESLVAG
ncbi:MAG: carboxypeptidase regulatory-like domain-containing protein [Planctomycetes bacterium]|nr:carboxypeptidase regulatory-like domain-containing protein [Planctomycetota bacterium]